MIHIYNTIQFNLNTTTLHKIHNYTNTAIQKCVVIYQNLFAPECVQTRSELAAVETTEALE